MTAHSFLLPAHWADRPVRIALIGAGGSGSQIADQLASLETTLRKLGHCGFNVSVFDGDVVSDSSVGRQRFTQSDVGAHKSMLIVHRVNAFYGLAWRAIPQHYRIDKTQRYLNFDLVITAVDLAGFRAELGRTYRNEPTGALWLDLGNGEDSGQVVLGHLGCAVGAVLRLPNVFDLYPELASMEALDREAPSCSTEEAIRRQSWPINRLAALTATELLWSLLRHGRIETHGAFFRLAPMTIQPLVIDPQAWSFLGYDATEKEPQRAA